MREMKLDFRSEVPIYTQIVKQIRQLLANGELHVGDQLPTVRELAAELRVNFNTVARAYRLLDEAGLISTQRGRGTYIWEQPSEASARKSRLEALERQARHYLDEAAGLGFTLPEAKAAFERQYAAWKAGGVQPEGPEGEAAQQDERRAASRAARRPGNQPLLES